MVRLLPCFGSVFPSLFPRIPSHTIAIVIVVRRPYPYPDLLRASYLDIRTSYHASCYKHMLGAVINHNEPQRQRGILAYVYSSCVCTVCASSKATVVYIIDIAYRYIQPCGATGTGMTDDDTRRGERAIKTRLRLTVCACAHFIFRIPHECHSHPQPQRDE